jgi:hypothetical protein
LSQGIHAWIQAKAAGGSRFWHGLGRITGSISATSTTTTSTTATTAVTATGVTAALGLLWFATGHHPHSLHELFVLLCSSGVSLAAVAFPTMDYCALKDETGNYSSPLTPGPSSVQRQFYLRAEQERTRGRTAYPIKLTDICFALSFALDQPQDTDEGATSSPIFWDELFQVTDSFEIQSPRFGLICERNSISGPVWKHMLEYIGNGYAYSGDDPFATIAANTSATECGNQQYVLTLYHTYPIMQRYLAKPEETAMFIGWLQNSLLRYSLASTTSLQGASATATIDTTIPVILRAGYRYLNGAVGGDPKQAMQVPPLAYARVLKVPANGQIDILFPQLANSGPQNCDVSKGERLVAAVLLSNNLGLPGPKAYAYTPFNPLSHLIGDVGVSEIGCEQLGLRYTQNPDFWVAAKLANLRRNPITSAAINAKDGAFVAGPSPYCTGWPYTLQGATMAAGITTGGVNEQPTMMGETLLGLPFALPELGVKVSKMPRVRGNLQVHVRDDSPAAPSTGNPGPQHCLYLHTLRDIDGTYAAGLLAAAGVSGRVTRDVNHDADAAVASGKIDPGSYVGMPHVAK